MHETELELISSVIIDTEYTLELAAKKWFIFICFGEFIALFSAAGTDTFHTNEKSTGLDKTICCNFPFF